MFSFDFETLSHPAGYCKGAVGAHVSFIGHFKETVMTLGASTVNAKAHRHLT